MLARIIATFEVGLDIGNQLQDHLVESSDRQNSVERRNR